MPHTTEVVPMDTVQKELTEIKGKIETFSARLYAVERKSDLQDQQIFMLNEKLSKIEDNTTWIKRTIMGGIITAICTGVIGGAIAIGYAVLQQ
ncbi:hemolysin XhlA family protein [Priestia aryabhattai]|uniref:hemolysin XhlA family protein n=1 Tax=Priestia aryabhattai TaxID=412384 RepID=UPI002E1D2A8D|nr:hemolysin XhlA family protein [Priestia aryabhattai]MED4261465.1 hemolysin XhlA family protein [Priestia aryabhattai]